MEEINIEIYNDLENDELKTKYLEFENKVCNANITSSWGWIKKWWEIFADYNNNKFGFDKKLRIVILSQRGKIISIAPLVILKRKFFGVKISSLEFLSQQWAAIYCDLIAIEEKCDYLNIIIEKILLTDKIDIVSFNHIPGNSKFFKKDKLVPYEACPEVDLEQYGSVDDYRKKRYSKNLNQNIRTAHNRASKNNMILSGKTELADEKSFIEIIRIAKTKLLDGKDFKYADSRRKQFRIEIMSYFRSSQCFIYANNHPVAYRTNVIFNGYKFCLDAAYDREYPRYDLGSLSVDANIKDSFENELKRHCMGPGLDFYKLKFATHIITLNYYIRKGNTLFSILVFYLISIKLKRKTRSFSERLSRMVDLKNCKVDN